MSESTTGTPAVTISRAEYDNLLQSQETLMALEAAGVDNWPGFGDAMDILHGEVEE